MNKKLICTLMAGALLVGTVTGCGSSSEGDSSAKGTELELFSSKAENKDILQKLVDKFNETHEDVTKMCIRDSRWNLHILMMMFSLVRTGIIRILTLRPEVS